MTSTSAVPTAQLVARARAGEDPAYERLFARVTSRLLAYVRVRLGGSLRRELDPLDVLQEVFVRAHVAFPAFEPQHPGAFVPWLFTIADNCLRDLAEHHGALKRRPPAPLARGSTVLAKVRDEHTNPASRCVRHETVDRLVAAMAELAPDEREVLLLRYFQEKSVEEVVAALGRSRSTVLRTLGRARIKLGHALRAGE
ncbi:MAG: sigma-70 family RNA polymerase sigma factor [Planctomycetota bacterium]